MRGAHRVSLHPTSSGRRAPSPRGAASNTSTSQLQRSRATTASMSGASPLRWASPIAAAENNPDSTLVSSSSLGLLQNGTTERVEELQHHLAYTQEVLRKYKHYVETKVMDQLRQSQRAVEALQLDCQRVERERDKLMEALSGKNAELEARKNAMSEFTDTLSRDSQQGSLKLAEQISTLEKQHAAQVNGLRKTIEELQSDAVQKHALQTALSRRDEEVKRLRQSIAESSNRTAWLQNDHAAFSEITQDIKESSARLLDFFNTVTSAVGDQLLRTTNLPDQSVLGQVRDLPPLEQHASPGMRSSSTQSSAQAVALLVKSFQEQQQLAQREVVVMLKVLLEAHMSAIGSYEEAMSEADKERSLFRRRMEELEEDRAVERRAMEQQLEDHKLKNILAKSSPSQLLGVASNTRSAKLADGSVDVASMLMQPSSSPSRRQRVVSTGVQTAIDVAVFTPSGNTTTTTTTSTAGSGSSNSHVPLGTYNRVLHEVSRLQNENHELRSSVQVLDAQRRRFLGFVNNDAITTKISKALSGSGNTSSFIGLL